MPWLLVLVGLVAQVQAVAWLARGPERRAKRASLLLAGGLLFFALGLVWGMIPDFFSDRVGFDGG